MTDYLALAKELAPQQDTGDNPYMPLAQEAQTFQRRRVQTVVETALRDDPDIAAERLRISKQSGVPLRIVERNLDELRIKERAKTLDLARMASESPVLYRQMTDPTFTTPAVDDLPTLQKIEQTIGKGTAYLMGADGKGGLPSDAVDFAKDVGLGATVGVGKMMFNMAGVVNDLIGWETGAKAARGQAKRAQEAMDAFGSQGQSSTAQAVRSGAQSAGANLALLPIGLERSLFQTANAAASAVAGLMSAGVGADAYNRARDTGRSQLQAGMYAIPEATFEYVFEKIPASKLFGDIAMNETLLKTLGKQAVSEGWTEQVTTLAQDFNEWMNLNPNKTMGEFIQERPEAAYQTFIATLVGVGVQTSTIKGINKIVEQASNQQLKFEQDLLDQQMQLAAQSMLRQRSPEQFRAHVQAVVEENPSAKREVYVDGEVLNQLAPELLAQLPESVREQIEEAAASASTVAIPMADVLTIAPGTPLEQILNEHARMNPDAPSKAEAQLVNDMLRQDAERVLADAQDQQAWQQSADTVKQTILGQLNTAGRFTPDVNDAYSTLVRDFYSVMAGRVGVTPDEMYRRYPLRVAAGGQSAARLDQADLVTDDNGEVLTFYHGGNKPFAGIQPGGRFGGAIFARQGSPSGYGTNEQAMHIKGPILELDQMRELLLSDEGAAALEKYVPADSDSFDLVAGALTDGSHYPTDQTVWDAIGAIDEADAQTEIQRLRGKLARDLGFNAVRTPDEFDGDTVMVVNNDAVVLPQQLNQPATPQPLPATINVDGKERPTDEATGLPLNPDGTVTVYHHTGAASAEAIRKTGRLKSAAEPDVYVTTRQETDTGYGDTAVAIRVNPELLQLDDEFPDGRQDFRIDTGKPGGSVRVQVGEYPQVLNQSAFHGTPHRGITRFSTDKIGTGEGNQAFGWGLYFASKKEVAESYREKLSGSADQAPRRFFKGTELEPGTPEYHAARLVESTPLAKARKDVAAWIKDADTWSEKRKADPGEQRLLGGWRRTLEVLNEATGKGDFTKKAAQGQLYEVDIPEDDQMLLFDKPITSQPDAVKKVLKESGLWKELKDNLDDYAAPMNTRGKLKGENIYNYLAWKLGSEKAASLRLLELGIPGLKYPGGTIAGVKNAGYNYVIFSGDDVAITNQFYQNQQQARGTYSPDQILITLNESANLSTFLHESGHFFLEVMADLASQPNAPTEVQDDMNRLLKWFGIKGDEQVGGPDAGGELAQTFKIPPPKKLYRGEVSEQDRAKRAGGAAWSVLGKGLYTTRDKTFAKQFGTVREVRVEDAWPRNPLVIDNAAGGADAAVWNWIRENNHFTGRRAEFEKAHPDLGRFIQALGYDGVLAGDEVVKYETVTRLAPAGLGNSGAESEARSAGEGSAGYAGQNSNSRQLTQDGNAPTDNTQPAGRTPLEVWNAMTLDQKRPHHERFAESFEAYLFEGKAPNAELQPLFRRFRSWLVNVYKSLTEFMRGRNLKLSDDIRKVMDRMLATDEQIAQAEQASGLLPEFDANAEAAEKLQARSLRDLRWTINTRNKALKALQQESAELRRMERMEARREIMQQPVYRAWRFLTGRLSKEDKAMMRPEKERKSVDGPVDESIDSLFVAIAKLGGLDRAQVESQWGWDKKERTPTPLFGKPLLRRNGGLSLDSMAQRLAEYGYLPLNENGQYELSDFESAFESEYRDSPVYAYAYDYARAMGEKRAGEGASEEVMGAGRLDLSALRALGVGDDVVSRLQEYGMTAKDGIDPAIVADMFGFELPADLVTVLSEATPLGEAIEGRTDQRMLENFGELATPEAIEEAANDAVHNEARAKSLATELKAQADMLNTREQTGTASNGRAITVNTLVRAAKEFGANIAARRRVKDLKAATQQHRAAEARAGKKWQDATAKAQTQDAVQAKRDQTLNHYTVRALLDAQAEVKKIREFFAKVADGNNEKLVEKGRDPDVVNAMRAILAAYDVRPRMEKGALDYMETVARNDPTMFGALNPTVQAAVQQAKPLSEMTMEELRGLYDEMRGMWQLAKRSRQMEIDGNLLDREELEDQLVARMTEIGIPDTVPGEKGAVTDGEEAGTKLQFAKAILTRAEQWAERMDGKFGGPFLRYVFQPIKLAADRYRTDRTAYRKKFTTLVENIAPTLKPGPIDAPELGYKFGNAKDSGVAELLHAILHTGNESNKRKLLLGGRPDNPWATENEDGTLDTAQWDAFIQRMVSEGVLKREHFDFAQGVWDLLEETKPLAQKAHREVFGRYFAEVTADEFVDPFGVTRRGGYAPAQTDTRLVNDQRLRELAEGENESLAYAFPSAPNGFTKSRVEYNKPLLLDLRALAQHMDKVLLFSHMQPAVTDVRRLLTSKRVSYALNRIDPAVYEGLLIPWLNRAAKQIVETPVVGDRKLSRFFSQARSRAGMAMMMANLSNTAQQITGFSLAAVKVKPSIMMNALVSYTANPKAMRESVASASDYMRDRMQNEVSAMNDVVEDVLVNPSLYERSQAWTQRHAYFLQAAVDNNMSPIIWTAAYNQATGQGMDHTEAVRFADGVIRQTQGSTLPEDVSRFETGPGYARLFTQFVSYFNMMANTNATAFSQIVESTGLRKGAGKLLYVAVAGLLAPIWVAEAIAQAFKGGPEDEDRDGWLDDWLAAVFGTGTIKGAVAMVPIVGQAAQLAVNQFNDSPADDKFSLSPAVSLIESAVRTPKSVYDAIVEEGKVQKAARDVAAAATLITGLPFYAAARPIGYAAGMAAGQIEPTSDADMVRGLVTGVATQESKR